jgi:hydroxymethylpyrimidine/phosphomethylpyrimidine kinase
VTAQDTSAVHAVHYMPPDLVRGQIEAALGDIGADAIKIGMLGNGGIAAAVADALQNVLLPLVLDPVLLSTSGAVLLDDEGLVILKTRLIPRATLITPNLPEAEALSGIKLDTDASLRDAAHVFQKLGAKNILFKGGHVINPLRPSHLSGATATSPASAPRAGEGHVDMARDVLITGDDRMVFEAPRQNSRHTHGTGCTLATAIACGLALGQTLADATAKANAYLQNAIRTAPGLGRGHGPLGH